ncbi:unnamed protein product [Victoria cruziana]
MCDTSKTIPTPTLPLPLMVGKLNTSAIVSMEPRNVMLEKKKEKKVRDEKEAEVNHEREKNVAAELAGPSEPKPADEGLLRAIASFLGRRGFSKTLSALQSENRGVVVNSIGDDIHLEYVYYKYLKDRCVLSSGGQFSGLKEKDSLGGLQINGNKSEVILSGVVKGKVKKKKDRKASDDFNAEDAKESDNEKSGKFCNFGDALENIKPVCTGLDGKSKDATLRLEEPKCGKKMKKSSQEDASQNHGKTSELTYKKKKKKCKSTSDGSHCENGNTEDWLLLEGLESTNSGDAKMLCYKAANPEADVQPHLSLTTSKERKRKPTVEDLQGHLTSHEDVVDDGEGMIKGGAHNWKSKDAELAQVKIRKKLKDLVNGSLKPCVQVSEQSKRSLKTSMPIQGSKADMKGNPEAVNSLKKIFPEGNIEDKELEGCSAETHKKDSEGSAARKTVNAFRRVNPDEVTFADERLQDNSYWAKSGAESGYGAKAQEVLGQVRGKDFRHEKTKKKRGSYRGGLIDLQTHSIKFSYSDDE